MSLYLKASDSPCFCNAFSVCLSRVEDNLAGYGFHIADPEGQPGMGFLYDPISYHIYLRVDKFLVDKATRAPNEAVLHDFPYNKRYFSYSDDGTKVTFADGLSKEVIEAVVDGLLYEDFGGEVTGIHLDSIDHLRPLLSGIKEITTLYNH